MQVNVKSDYSGHDHSKELAIDEAAYKAWVAEPKDKRKPAGDVFPHLSKEDLHFLETGETPEEVAKKNSSDSPATDDKVSSSPPNATTSSDKPVSPGTQETGKPEDKKN